MYTAEEALGLMEEEGHFDHIAIEPPSDGEASAEESGAEDTVETAHLSGRQLRARATIVTESEGERQDILEAEEDQESLQPSTSTSHSARSAPSQTQRTWSKSDLTTTEKARFTWPSRADKIIDYDKTPAGFFELFFDDEVYQIIIAETLRYAAQKGKHDLHIDENNVRLFIAILLISGYNVLPRRRLYWSADPSLRNEAICAAMSRNSFDEFLQYLHLANNDQLDKADKYAKVRPLMSALGQRFLKEFPFQQNVAVDESMVPYFGRHSGKMFIRGKPIRFGYKIWSCCTQSGYLVTLEPYQGASGHKDTTSFGVGGGVVLRLVENLPRNPYRVYKDNFLRRCH